MYMDINLGSVFIENFTVIGGFNLFEEALAVNYQAK